MFREINSAKSKLQNCNCNLRSFSKGLENVQFRNQDVFGIQYWMTSSPTKVILSREFVQAHRSQARLISSLPLIILERWSSPAVNFRCWGSCSESYSGDIRSLEKESGPGSAGLKYAQELKSMSRERGSVPIYCTVLFCKLAKRACYSTFLKTLCFHYRKVATYISIMVWNKERKVHMIHVPVLFNNAVGTDPIGHNEL